MRPVVPSRHQFPPAGWNAGDQYDLALREFDVDSLQKVPTALAAVEEALQQYENGQASNQPRQRIFAQRASFTSCQAGCLAGKSWGVKLMRRQ
jgi:hypothetical protein